MSTTINRRQIRQRPHFAAVDLPTGLRWQGGGAYRYEEKIDGVYCERTFEDCLFAGELKDGVFHGFDIISEGNRALWRLPLFDRLQWFEKLQPRFGDQIKPVRHGHGGEFLEMILSEGGEGIVGKHLGAFFGKMGAWIKCKREETHDCMIVEVNREKSSAHLFQQNLDRGWCKVPAVTHAGQIIEVRCHSIHKSGKFREAVFVRVRQDKQA